MRNVQQLPPWGQMDALVLGLMRSRPIPEAWRSNAAGNTEEQWQLWRDSLIQDLESMLWPRYDPAQGTWTRPPDLALMDADFKLMEGLKREGSGGADVQAVWQALLVELPYIRPQQAAAE